MNYASFIQEALRGAASQLDRLDDLSNDQSVMLIKRITVDYEYLIEPIASEAYESGRYHVNIVVR